MDVLWFRLPRRLEDPKGVVFRFGRGLVLGLIDRSDYWQVSYVIPKGNYQQLRSAGLEVLQRTIAELVPELTDRVELLKDWTQVSLLSVESSRLCCWYRPGLLLIGDAAHVMSPVGGVGINYAIQDAVVAANALVAPLKEHRLMTRDLAVVQRQREWPTRLIQAYQTLVQQRLLASTLNSNQLLTFPLFFRLCLRLPVMRNLPAQLMAFGLWPAHVKH
jgi:2-polyprenyl-6-methoxyphenol hydroxylase-like FAD-dependent oxidoreductase